MVVLNIWFLFIFAFICATVESSGISEFYYFAYGSNLLKNRMHINCKTARFLSSARLDAYRLDFNKTSGSWEGAVATIVPYKNRTVWGTLWIIAIEEQAALDEQEGVTDGWYKAANVSVILDHEKINSTIMARTYIQIPYPPYEQILPLERRPSQTYIKVIRLGAIESKLPVCYIEELDAIPDNERKATCAKRRSLGYPFYDDSVCH